MIWFLHNLARLSQERAAIENLQATTSWLKAAAWGLEGSALRLDAEIEAHGFVYPVRMLYPDTFPASPPTVFPRNQRHRWSAHQYGPGGELCLEWGPDTWMTEVTGAQMLMSAHKLLVTENPLGITDQTQTVHAPSRHALSAGQEMRWSIYRFLATNSLHEHFRSLPQHVAGEISVFALLWQHETISVIVAELQPDGMETWVDALIPQRLAGYAVKWRGLFVKSLLTPASVDFNTIEELKMALGESGAFTAKVEKALNTPDVYRVFLIEDVHGGLHLYCLPSDTANLIRFKRLDLPDTHQWERLGVNSETFRMKKVGIVGIGSAGSKIAVSLARSGINCFVLVDDDLFLPENICRHTLDWRSIGEHKVVAIEDQLALISPTIEADVRRLKLTGQESTASIAGVLSALANCDLIIDATADPNTFNSLAMVAEQYQRPMIWLEVYAGGIGGMVARYRPGKDMEPHQMRKYYHAFTAQTDAMPVSKTVPYVLEQADGPLIASDADVTVIASHATRFALDSLSEREPSSFPYPMYLIGLSRAWIFDQPFQTIPIDTGSASTKNTPETAPEVMQQGIDFISKGPSIINLYDFCSITLDAMPISYNLLLLGH